MWENGHLKTLKYVRNARKQQQLKILNLSYSDTAVEQCTVSADGLNAFVSFHSPLE